MRLRSVNYFWFAAVVGATVIGLLIGSLKEFAQEADRAARLREETVISNGIQSRMREIGSLVVPTAVWDDAVVNLDNNFSSSWADKNIGQFFSAANNFEFAYVVDAQDRAIYGMEAGKDVTPSSYEKVGVIAGGLIAQVRAAEQRRVARPSGYRSGDSLREPIQATSAKRIGSGYYFVTATLVQPDFGSAQITADRAPILITGRKLDEAFLAEFGGRYLLEDVHLHGDARFERGEAHATIKDEAGADVATLDWLPQTPGSVLFAKIVPWTLGLLLSLLSVALLLYRKARRSTDELVESEGVASHIAYHDALTQLPNRAYLERCLADYIQRARAFGHTAAVHCLDLDHFKELNDIFGPEVGDEALRLIAQRLRLQCSRDDICVRFGGDGFAVVQTCGESADADAMARRIVSALSVPLDLSVGSRSITCSVGFAIADEAGVNALEFVRRADLALHVAKGKGRSCHCRFNPALDEDLRSRHELLDDLRCDIAMNRLRMVYQPQVDGLGNIIGVEALVRWTHSRQGAVSPAIFIPLAESSGLIADLGNFTIRRVLEDSRRWPDLKVAINISAVQLRMPGFAASLMRMTAEARVDPRKIEIEITESVLLTDDEQIQSTLQELRADGFSLALDDFGTGYSSLSYLRRFPINKIKIDRAFISTLGLDRSAEAVVTAIVTLAHALNLSVIAEGVETNDQWLRLIKAGCSEIQGFIASKAVEADRIVTLIERAGSVCPAPAVES